MYTLVCPHCGNFILPVHGRGWISLTCFRCGHRLFHLNDEVIDLALPLVIPVQIEEV